MTRGFSYANTMSLAVVLALTIGGAFAAGKITSNDIKNETIRSEDIKNGSVLSKDIKNGQVTGADIKDRSLTGGDVKDNALTGSDLNERTLDLGGFSASKSAINTNCAADDGSETTCASATLTLAHAAPLLLNATGSWTTFVFDDTTGAGSGSDDTQLVRGSCSLAVDGTKLGTPTAFGEYRTASVPAHPSASPGTFALTALSTQLAAGPHTVAVLCREEDGDIDFGSINLTASTD